MEKNHQIQIIDLDKFTVKDIDMHYMMYRLSDVIQAQWDSLNHTRDAIF